MVYLLTVITGVLACGCAIAGIFDEALAVVYIPLALIAIYFASTHLPHRKSIGLVRDIILVATLASASFVLSEGGMLVIALSLIAAYTAIGAYSVRSER